MDILVFISKREAIKCNNTTDFGEVEIRVNREWVTGLSAAEKEQLINHIRDEGRYNCSIPGQTEAGPIRIGDPSAAALKTWLELTTKYKKFDQILRKKFPSISNEESFDLFKTLY